MSIGGDEIKTLAWDCITEDPAVLWRYLPVMRRELCTGKMNVVILIDDTNDQWWKEARDQFGWYCKNPDRWQGSQSAYYHLVPSSLVLPLYWANICKPYHRCVFTRTIIILLICFLLISNIACLALVVDISNYPPISLFLFITLIKCLKFLAGHELPDRLHFPVSPTTGAVIRASFGNGFELEWQVQILGHAFLTKPLVLHFFLPLLVVWSWPAFLSPCLK